MILLAILLTANPHLPVAQQQLRALDEKAALKTLDRAIAHPDTTQAELAQIWLCIGLAHAGLLHEKDARAAFRTALSIDPTLELPPGTNPKWKDWWDAAKVERPLAPGVPVAPDPVVLPPPPAPPPPQPGLPGWRVGLGVGLAVSAIVAVTAGALVGLQAKGLSTSAAAAPEVGHAVSLQREAEGRATTANLLYGAGGAFGVGAGLAFFWP